MRMRFSGKEELYRIIRIVHNLGQTFQICKEQMSTLVSSKTTSETNQQSIGVNLIQQSYDAGRITLILQPSLTVLLTHIIDKLVLQCHTCLPDFFIRHIIDSLPYFLVRLVIPEVFIKVGGIELFPLRCTPCREVYTIGHIAHVILLGEISLPDRSKHLLRHLSMQPAYTIYLL